MNLNNLSPLLCLALISFSFQSMAENIQELTPVIVSLPAQSDYSMPPATRLDGQNLSMKQAATIGETLKEEAGIHSMSFGVGVGQPVIRGQTGSRAQVLQNGLGSLDVSSASPDHANSTEALLAERIEVLRGPASLLYRSGATGAVVNVIDNRIPMQMPERAELAVEQRYQSVADQWRSIVKHDGGVDNFAWHVDGVYRHSDNYHASGSPNGLGFVANSDAESWSASVGGSWLDDWGMIGFSYNRLDNNYGIPPVDEPVRIDLKQHRFDAKAQIDEPLSWVESLKFRFAYNDYRHAELEGGVQVGTQFKNRGVEGRAELVHGAIGFIDHGVWGIQAGSQDMSVSGAEAFVPPSVTRNYTAFLLEDMQTGEMLYEFAARMEQQIIDANGFSSKYHTPVNASLSAKWGAAENLSFSLTFSHMQRAPDVVELFADGLHFATQNYQLGQPNLKLETSYNLELGFSADFDWISPAITLFHHWSQDYILSRNSGRLYNLNNKSFVSACPSNASCLPVFQSSQQDARFYGYEAQIALPLWQNPFQRWQMTLFSDFVRGELAGGGNAPRMPPLRYGVQFDYHQQEELAAKLRLTRAQAQTHVADNETPTAGYWLLNVSVSWQPPVASQYELLLFAKGNNLLDQTIRNATSFLKNHAPEPGRGVELGIRLSF